MTPPEQRTRQDTGDKRHRRSPVGSGHVENRAGRSFKDPLWGVGVGPDRPDRRRQQAMETRWGEEQVNAKENKNDTGRKRNVLSIYYYSAQQ